MDKVKALLLRKLEEAKNFDDAAEINFITEAIKEYTTLKNKIKSIHYQLKDGEATPLNNTLAERNILKIINNN